MKINLLLFLAVAYTSINNSYSQNSRDFLVNKTFVSEIGSICEETPDDNPCAGLTEYATLEFKRNSVKIIEKQVSSCDSTYINTKLECNWRVNSKNEVKLNVKPKEIKYKFIEGLRLKIKNDTLFGYKKTEEYIFNIELKN